MEALALVVWWYSVLQNGRHVIPVLAIRIVDWNIHLLYTLRIYYQYTYAFPCASIGIVVDDAIVVVKRSSTHGS